MQYERRIETRTAQKPQQWFIMKAKSYLMEYIYGYIKDLARHIVQQFRQIVRTSALHLNQTHSHAKQACMSKRD